jgi:coenzyme F420-reducing hydrogenase delta subunit
MKRIVFNCNWCTPQVEDVEKINNTPVIRLICIGRFDGSFALKAIQKGIEEVVVVGCREEECKYNREKGKIEKEIEKVNKIVKLLGMRKKIKFLTAKKGEDFWKEIENGD